MNTKKVFFIMGLILLLSGCVTNEQYLANNFQEGKNNFELKNYRVAYEKLLPVARAGNRDAQYAVGYMYYYGKGTLEDHTKARYWMVHAAKQGQPLAKEALVKLKK
jgi:TPR repeat protein